MNPCFHLKWENCARKGVLASPIRVDISERDPGRGPNAVNCIYVRYKCLSVIYFKLL